MDQRILPALCGQALNTMRTALWLTALFAIAVAAALFADGNQGQIALFWPPWQVDVSANFAIAALALAFALLYAVLRTVAAVVQIPAQARRWRSQRLERALHRHLLHALTHAYSGRYVRAHKAALAALNAQEALQKNHRSNAPPAVHLQQARCIALMLAAEAAHALQDLPQRETRWNAVLASTRAHSGALAHETRQGAHLRAAQWALQDHDAQQALHHLGQLPQGVARRTQVLRLRFKAERLAGDNTAALATAKLLAKHHALSSAAADSVVRSLLLESVQQARDTAQLQRLWQSLDNAQRRTPEIALAATERLLALSQQAGNEAAPQQATQARAWLLPVWEQLLGADARAAPAPLKEASLPDTQLLRLVRALQDSLDSLDSAWLARIEATARRHPHDASLQYLAGMACVQRQLWGKAQQLLLHAADLLPDAALRARAWQQLARMAEHRQDSAAALHAWRQAALTAHFLDMG